MQHLEWKKNLGGDERVLNEIVSNAEKYRDAYQKAEHSECATIWCALLDIKSDINTYLKKANVLEDKVVKMASEWLKAKQTEKIIVKKEPVFVSRAEYRYGFGSWLLSIILIFLASLILANISWAEGTTLFSFWFSYLLAFSFMAIAGFVIIRSVSQMA